MTSENENKIGRWGLPRGEARAFRPVKLYKTSWDRREDELTELIEKDLIPAKIVQRIAEWSDEFTERLQSKIEPIEQEQKLREQTLSKVTPEERERLLLERTILALKTSTTGDMALSMSGILTNEIEDGGYDQDLIVKAAPLDPDFMNPIVTALNKRPARQEKGLRAVEHILILATPPYK